MPFCTTCGTNVEGKFCVKCGTPVGASAAPAAPATAAPAAPAPAVPAQAAPARKKTSPLVWVLVAVVGLFVLIGVAVVGGGFFLVHKAKQAGLDPTLWEKNPGLAATKMITAMNPDVQVIKIDEDNGRVTLRDKKSNKVYSIDFEAVKEGRIKFQEEGQPEVSLEAKGSGETGSFEMKSSTGETVRFGSGAAAQVPGWVPSYPDSKPEGTFSSQGSESQGGMFGFKTGDNVKKVLGWYEQSLKGAGFRVSTTVTDSGDSSGGMVSAEDASKRTVMVTVGTEDSRTAVQVVYGDKK